jgi:hypothetical protein
VGAVVHERGGQELLPRIGPSQSQGFVGFFRRPGVEDEADRLKGRLRRMPLDSMG